MILLAIAISIIMARMLLHNRRSRWQNSARKNDDTKPRPATDVKPHDAP